MSDDLYSFKVITRQDFAQFVGLLLKDFTDNPSSWENRTLADFLEALSRYTEDVQSYYDNTGKNKNADKPDWSIFADIFLGAKVYE